MTRARKKKIDNIAAKAAKYCIAFIDLFCGFGGTSKGAEDARIGMNKIASVAACVNHDPIAIECHEGNMPDALHFVEDIRTLDLTELTYLVNEIRRLWKIAGIDGKIYLWASLECTNFSNAKGGLPRDADSRTLAEHLFRYLDAFNPDMIWIENVREFMSWGPLDEKGKPVSRKAGRDYMLWVEHIKSYGYEFDYRLLNSADFGAYTSRERLFIQFAKKGIEITWPAPSHSKKVLESAEGLFGQNAGLKKWKPVREVLDLHLTGESIFSRKKNLSDKTYERIYHGLVKFVAGGKDAHTAFIVKYNSANINGKQSAGHGLDKPSPVVATQGRLALASADFLTKYYSGKPEHKNISIDGPTGAFTTTDSHALVKSEFLINYHHSSDVDSIDKPLGTLTTKDKKGLISSDFIVQRNNGNPESKLVDLDGPARTITTTGGNQEVVNPEFIAAYYGNGHNCSSVNDPAPTIPTKDRCALVKPQFIMRDFSSGGGKISSLDKPGGSLLPFPKMNLVTPEPWLMDTQFNNTGGSINNPAGVQTANRKHFYLMNPQWFNNNAADVNQPCFTLIARMDKAPPYLVQTEQGEIMIEVYETDTEYMRKIKEFMSLYGIVDIKMRMLFINELLRIQGFPDTYYFSPKATQTDKKKFIGNSVVPIISQRLTEANYMANFLSAA